MQITFYPHLVPKAYTLLSNENPLVRNKHLKQIKIHDGASSDYSIEEIKYPWQSLLCY